MDLFTLFGVFMRYRLILGFMVIALIGFSFSAFAIIVVMIRSTGNIPVSMAYAIDQKIDDGMPTTGSVQAVYLDGDIAFGPVPANNSLSDSATSCYNTTFNTFSVGFQSGSGPNCALSFRFQ